MVNGNCAVVGCTSSNYQLKKWRKELCKVHEGSCHIDCPCSRLFTLHRFPSELLNSTRRKIWINQIKRETRNKTAWTPGQSDMVCSKHFVDGCPSLENPDPTLELEYEKKTKKQRRVLVSQIPEPIKFVTENDEDADPLNETTEDTMCCDAEAGCLQCQEKDDIISSLQSESESLKAENDQLKVEDNCLKQKIKQVQSEDKPFSWKCIKKDTKMKFYTGLQTIQIFCVLFELLKPCLPNLVYWRGKKRVFDTSYKKSTCANSQQKVTGKDQLLLTLMRLRLGLMFEDVADRFCISVGTCSNIFSTWVRLLGNQSGEALIVWLPRDIIHSHLPEVFVNAGYTKTRSIIDCTEIFIERPKSVDAQAPTWSDYMRHNTIKSLIGISPCGFITYISDSYGEEHQISLFAETAHLIIYWNVEMK